MTLVTRFSSDWRFVVLASYVVITIVWVASMSPIPQDQTYHIFADQRVFLGIPNFFDVVSNILFLIVGIHGLKVTLQSDLGELFYPWLTFFSGVLFLSIGSAYYHWDPHNDSLVWDRLPMALGFMGFFTALIGEYVGLKRIRPLLILTIFIGIGSVVLWRLTDDLRFYGWVQFMPLGVLIVFLALFRSRFSHSWLLAVAICFYTLAKVFEYFDARIYHFFSETISGHTIKHCLAAAGCYTLAVLLQKRSLRI